MEVRILSKPANLAQKLIDAMGLEPGFDIEEVVNILGGEVCYSITPGFEAYIEKKGEEFCIYVDSSKSKRRQRFSIAHEIGHLFLHLKYTEKNIWNSIKDTNSRMFRYGYDQLEAEANQFAAEFLMPKQAFIESVVRLSSNGFVNIFDIANEFDTSEEAVKYRGFNLGIWKL